MRIIFLFTALLIAQSVALQLQDSGTIVWLPTDYYVETTPTFYSVDYIYENPCDTIPRYYNATIYGRLVEFSRKIVRECSKIYEKNWITVVDEIKQSNNPRHKRGIQEYVAFGFGGLTGVAVSNIISTVWSRIDPSSDYNQIRQLRSDLRQTQEWRQAFEKTMALTKQWSAKIDELAEKLVQRQNTIENIQDITIQVDQQLSEINLKTTIAAERLKRILGHYKSDHTSIVELTRLLNIPELNDQEYSEGKIYSISSVIPGSIHFQFMVRNRSFNSRIYRASGMTHWSNLTGNPVLLELADRHFILHNSTSKCAKLINEPDQHAVQEDCLESNEGTYLDYRWRESINVNWRGKKPFFVPTFKRTSYNNYVYCYFGSISINGTKHECPPFPFRLSIKTAWECGSEKYLPKTNNMTVPALPALDWLITDLRVNTTTVDIKEALSIINDLHSQIDAIKVEKGKETWVFNTGSNGIMIGFILGIVLVFLIILIFKWLISTPNQPSVRIPKFV